MEKKQDSGVPPSGSGCQPTASAADASSQSGIPNAKTLGFDLAKATPEQLGILAKCMAELIGIYADSVRGAQERYEKDCAFLANLMAELSKVNHCIARIGAQALEEQYAQGIAAGTDETAQQAQPEGQEPGPKDAPEPHPQSTETSNVE